MENTTNRGVLYVLILLAYIFISQNTKVMSELISDYDDLKILHEENSILKTNTIPAFADDKVILNMAERDNKILNDAITKKKSYESETGYTLQYANLNTKKINEEEISSIDLGESDGIIKNASVLGPNGLIGIISKVHENSSEVNFLTNLDDSSSSKAISITIKSKQQEFGIIDNFENGYLIITKIISDSKIAQGDEVITSGLGGIFPKGLPIGIIEEIDRSSKSLSLEARLKLEIDPKKLSYVFVINPTKL
jgi:rod shape-determining protein MreC